MAKANEQKKDRVSTAKAKASKKGSDNEDDKATRESRKSSTVSASSSLSSSVDWYLLNIVVHLAIFAAIGVIDVASDFVADVCYQSLGIVLSLVRIYNPDHMLISEIFNVRTATRLLRPISLYSVARSRFAESGIASAATLFYSINFFHDVFLASVGAAILLRFPRLDVVKALYRETWLLLACVRLYMSAANGDVVAIVSCVCEIVATNCFIYIMLLSRSGSPIPARYVGMLGVVVSTQKLYYLVSPYYSLKSLFV